MGLPESSIDIIVHPGAERLSVRENFGPEGKPWEVRCDLRTTNVLRRALRSGKEFTIIEVIMDVEHPGGAHATKVELAFLEDEIALGVDEDEELAPYMPPPSGLFDRP